MKLSLKYQSYFTRLSAIFSTAIRFLLNLLLIIATLTIAVGVYKSAIDLWHSIHEPLETVLQNTLLDVVFIVALVEITSTIIGYLRDGHVHVRYIVDTVLIIMLDEIVAVWYKHPSFENAASLSLIIGTLAVVRVAVTRFAPNTKRDD